MVNWYPLSFQSDGTLAFPDQVNGQDGILTTLLTHPDGVVIDLWILSYGWNTSVQEGKSFYDTWVKLLRSEIQKADRQNYHPMFVGIFWPSKILADTSSQPHPSLSMAATSAPSASVDERARFIQEQRSIFDPEQRRNNAEHEHDFGTIYDFIATPNIQDPQQVGKFVDTLKKYQQQDPHADQLKPENVIDTNAPTLAKMLTTVLTPRQDVSEGLLDFLRVFSFWTMKGRAGTIGAKGLAPFLGKVRQALALKDPSLRIHLMGHSFGAKLLTSALYSTTTIPGMSQPVATTLILFQGAFSQFSFSRKIPDHPNLAGFYVKVVDQGLVATPPVVMYSTKDLANGRLYPIGMAPILEQFVVQKLPFPPPDPSEYEVSNDFRGSIGANGAQGFDESEMYLVALPWPGIDQSKLNTTRCINVNRTPFLDSRVNDPLVGIHNDYTEPEIFQAALAVSLLKPGK